eukprot:365809-Chlamydomonas_euryale.AAC.3
MVPSTVVHAVQVIVDCLLRLTQAHPIEYASCNSDFDTHSGGPHVTAKFAGATGTSMLRFKKL